MSKSLGAIHYKLYNKIKRQSNLNLIIYDEFKPNCLINKIGSIEEEIDINNIHSSLYELINKTEYTYANLINTILDNDINNLDRLKKICFNFGEAHKFNSDISLEEAFNKIDSFFLNGMPCDKAISIKEVNPREITYELNSNVHNLFNEFKYDIKYYYLLNDEIIKGLLIDTCYKVFRKKFEYKIKIL